MKVILPRIGALVALVVLGCIAMAHAQRSGAKPPNDDTTTYDAATSDGTAPYQPGPSNSGVNPLRAKSAQASALPASGALSGPATTIPTGNPIRRPIAEPSGLQARRDPSGRSTSSLGADTIPDASELNAVIPSPMGAIPARNLQRAAPVAADQLNAGPALGGPEVAPSAAGEEYSMAQEPSAQHGGSRMVSASSAAGSNQEPAQVNFDPFASPVGPLRSTASPLPSTVADQSRYNLPTSDRGPSIESAVDAEGTGQPGAKQLEGLQTPQVSIQKMAPKEIQVGKPAVFRVTVRNVGQIPASEVEVHDQIPKRTRFMSTTPRAARDANGELVWKLGTLRPGEETSVEMQVMPTAEGEVGSVASVHFGADASARCIATRPQLVVETSAPKQAMIGDQVVLSITISNPGTGVATGVVLEERIPAGMKHPAGSELEYEVGNLKPGESRKLDLTLVANQAGPLTNVLVARGDGNLVKEDKRTIEVIAPQLAVTMEGPKKRFLEREATYQVSVSNPGTAPAQQVELVAYLPPGLKFVNANNAGYYDQVNRTVRWRLEELPANETGSVELVTMPVEAGQQAIKLRGTAQKGLAVEKEQPVIVEGLAAIFFQVSTSTNPIEMGGETTYEVHVVNQGSKASNNVCLAVQLPPELKPVTADGPTRGAFDNGRIVFEGLARLAPKADTTYRIRVKGIQPGDLRTRFQLQTDEMQLPVTKEESTRVYADE